MFSKHGILIASRNCSNCNIFHFMKTQNGKDYENNIYLWGWRDDGLVIKRVSCCFRGPEFGLQYPY